MKQKLSTELTMQEQIMVEIAVLEERLVSVDKHLNVLTQEIKELKEIQINRVENHEKRITILEEKVNRHVWVVNVITALIITALVGGILSLIFKG